MALYYFGDAIKSNMSAYQRWLPAMAKKRSVIHLVQISTDIMDIIINMSKFGLLLIKQSKIRGFVIFLQGKKF